MRHTELVDSIVYLLCEREMNGSFITPRHCREMGISRGSIGDTLRGYLSDASDFTLERILSRLEGGR